MTLKEGTLFRHDGLESFLEETDFDIYDIVGVDQETVLAMHNSEMPAEPDTDDIRDVPVEACWEHAEEADHASILERFLEQHSEAWVGCFDDFTQQYYLARVDR